MTSNHGGPRPNSGRKPGEGPFRGGRPVSNFTVKKGQGFYVKEQTPEGYLPGELWEAVEMSRKKIVFRQLDSDRNPTGKTVTLIR